MVQTAVVLPVAVLASLAVAIFVFVFWWFPRKYKKGVAMDMAEVDEARRQIGSLPLDGTGQQIGQPLEAQTLFGQPQTKHTYKPSPVTPF